MRILLFDIDGVLVKPFGYRKAYFETCKWIIDQGNLNINLPADEIPALFESYGVTSEWDMLSITASIMVDCVITKNQISITSKSLSQALVAFASIEKQFVEIDFRENIQALASAFNIHEIPSIGVFVSSENYFNGISKALLKDILEDTRSAENTLMTRVFQNYVLGSVTFEQTYPLSAQIHCDSYLRNFDTSLLSEQTKNKLIQQKESGKLLFAALTARPSLQPRDKQSDDNISYSPEAEFALDVIGMPDMPLIGYGRLQFVEQLIGKSADLLIKPAAFHALAALFSLLGNSESLGLETAVKVLQEKRIPEWVRNDLPESLTICVFEDSQGGIRSVVSAANQLRQMGINAEMRLYGITQNEDKKQTLRNLNAMIFPDINEALKYEFNL